VPDKIYDFSGFVISILKIFSWNFDILFILQSMSCSINKLPELIKVKLEIIKTSKLTNLFH